MSAPYRDAATFDLERERAVHALRGAAVAVAAVASWSIADLVVAIITSLLVGSGGHLPTLWTRVALVVAGRIVPAALAIAFIRVASARPRAPRSSDYAWVAFFVLAAASVGATYETMEITRRMISSMSEHQLYEWTKDFEIVLRIESLAGPIALLLVLAYCLRRWEVAASTSRPSCPHCHEAL